MTDFMEIDERWSLWTPSEPERAHFCATRETVEWLFSRRDGESNPGLAKAFGGGGHARASGALIAGSLADVESRVLGEARNLLEAGALAD